MRELTNRKGKTSNLFMIAVLALQLLTLVACGEESRREVFLHQDRSVVQYRLFILLAGIGMALGLDTQAAQLIPWDVGSKYATELAKEGDSTKARLYFTEALRKAEEFGPQDLRLAKSLENLAGFYHNQSKFAEAETGAFLKRAVTFYEREGDPENPGLSASLNNLAGFYQEKGHFAEAEALFKRALAIRLVILGSSHPDVIVIQDNLASLYIAQRRFPEAEKTLKDSIALMKEIGGPVPTMIALLENYARVLQALRQNEEAEEITRRFTRLKNGVPIKDMERPDR